MNNITQIVNDFGESIVQVDGDIPVDLPTKNGDRFLFISYDQSFLTHGLHKYPAKFFPELPRWLIKRYSQETIGSSIRLLGAVPQMLRHCSQSATL